MKSDKILYSGGKNDEYRTPIEGVNPILPYIPKGDIVWCPFDKHDSNFVRQISRQNPVVSSHILDGQDFFKYEPPEWNIIISNSPFTKKRLFFERALSFRKPFALLMAATWLNDSAPQQIFGERLQLAFLPNRIHYMNSKGITHKKTTFMSVYFCYDFLPRPIVMLKSSLTNRSGHATIDPVDTTNVVLTEDRCFF